MRLGKPMNKPAIVLSLAILCSLVYLMMPSHYKTDIGNGITLYADKYVNSGEWVYHCKERYLVSRTPKVFPAQHFLETGVLRRGPTLIDPKHDDRGEDFVEWITQESDWYKPLKYSTTGLDEDSSISYHSFWLITEYEDKRWVVLIGQPDNRIRRDDYYIIVKPYDPATHRTHETALSAARTSCPKPQ